MSAQAERPSSEEVYAEHREPLIRFTRRLATRYGLPDPDRDAEDIVQATFEDALRQWTTVEQPARWLYTVARRKVVKTANQAARLGALTDGDDLDRNETRGWTSIALRPTPDDSVLARQVMDAIAEMPDRQRTVSYLRHVQGWTVQEVADLLDCAPGTVWAHTNHAVVAIRHRVGGDVVLEDEYMHGDYAVLYSRPRGCLLLFVGVVGAMAIVAYVACRAVRAGWAMPWPAVGLGATALVLLFVVAVLMRLGARWWRRRCRSRRS